MEGWGQELYIFISSKINSAYSYLLHKNLFILLFNILVILKDGEVKKDRVLLNIDRYINTVLDIFRFKPYSIMEAYFMPPLRSFVGEISSLDIVSI